MNLFFLFLLVPGPRVFHSDDVHCGSDGHNTRVDVNGGCLAFALPVMKHDVESTFCFFRFDLPILDISYEWNHTICGLLYPVSFA